MSDLDYKTIGRKLHQDLNPGAETNEDFKRCYILVVVEQDAPGADVKLETWSPLEKKHIRLMLEAVIKDMT